MPPNSPQHSPQGFAPVNPVQVERQIQEGNDLLDGLVGALKTATDRRYAAEAAYHEKRNLRLAYWMDQGRTSTHARAKAELEAQAEFEALVHAKAAQHHLDDLREAVQTRIYSLLNINKGMQATYQTYRG